MSEAEKYQTLKRIVSDALDLPASQRLAFIQEHCGGDADMLGEARSLLDQENALETGFMEQPAMLQLLGELSENPNTLPDQIGPYTIQEQLGEGGMGTVYLATQNEPVHRQVALKVVSGMHQIGWRERFHSECQTLAKLNHPNIATLYDAGFTENDNPYLAMELVTGSNIIDWCKKNRLSMRERLLLFKDVCAGVRHAHEKGVLHCDIKPSNVLVTRINDKPIAKVIDFGISQMLEKPEKQRFNSQYQAGSPAYMSPEAAARDNPNDLDTRSDVYSLGLLLYKLIIDTLPFYQPKQDLQQTIERLQKEDPPSMLIRFNEYAAEKRRKIAEKRGISVKKMLRYLNSDLHHVVQKSIARSPDQRYSSPADLWADIEHFMQREPVTAVKQNWMYLSGKFIHRRLALSMTTVALFVVLIGGVIARGIEAERANLEAERSKKALAETMEISEFLINLFNLADPDSNPEKEITARELVDAAAKQLASDLDQQPLARARFMQTIGTIYSKLDEFSKAEEMVGQALALRLDELKESDHSVIQSLAQLGVIQRRLNRPKDAEASLHRALDLLQRSEQDSPALRADIYNHLGNLYISAQRYDEAEQAHKLALQLRQQNPDTEPTLVADSMNNLGVVYRATNNWQQAAELLSQSIEIHREISGPDTLRVAYGLSNLAYIEEILNHFDRAESLQLTALDIWMRNYGTDHNNTMLVLLNLAKFMERRLRLEESIQWWDQVISSALVKRPLRAAEFYGWQGRVYGQMGDADAATAAFDRGELLYQAAPGNEQLHGKLLVRKAMGLSELWPKADVVELFERGREMIVAQAGRDVNDHVWALLELAIFLMRDEPASDVAFDLLSEADEIADRIYNTHHKYLFLVKVTLAEILINRGELDAAVSLLNQAQNVAIKGYGEQHKYNGQVIWQRARLAQAFGQIDTARVLARQAVENFTQSLPPGDAFTQRSRDLLQQLNRD